MLSEAVELYLQNRTGFYEILLTRLPDVMLRERLRLDVEPLSTAPLSAETVQHLSEARDELLAALKLKDLLKKPGYGSALAKTTISVDEALARAQRVEETGVILFALLIDHSADADKGLFREEFGNRKRALARIFRLEDELRYHRLKLTPLA
jgi:hypothetical protein